MTTKTTTTKITFNKIFSTITSNKENYIPRDYQTIGGMWTTDTYKFNGIICRIEDEGCSRTIIHLEEGETKKVLCKAYQFYDKAVRIDVGTEQDLENLLKRVVS